jgi:hypothetical protein
MSLFKAQAHMRELKQRLSMQMQSASFEDALDANGMPILVISENSEKHFVKIKTLDDASGHIDGLGLAQQVYSPHECLILREDQATSAPGNQDLRAKLDIACGKLGMKLTIKEGPGVKVAADYAAADALATTIVAIIRSDEINPLTQSQ